MMVQKAASGQKQKAQKCKSWPDLYKMKWLAVDRCRDTDGYTFFNEKDVCFITRQ